MTHEAFVSYAHDDKAVADEVCTKLEASAIPCWIAPRDTLAGVTYPGQIVDAIATSRVLVLILSSHSMQSRQVRSEVERAFTKGIPIVPLRIEDVLPEGDLEYLIGSVNWLDALIPPIEPRLDELATVVQRILAGEAPARAELRTNPNNLPAPVNRLIGRDHDIAEIQKRLSDRRLVTITGSGGVGKTRVAIEVGRSLLSAYRDGVWFVPLATVSDPTLVLNAVAQALAVPEGEDVPLHELLIHHLKKRRALVILDNCEHIIAEAADLAATITEACPAIQILATTREHLNIAGEWTYRLPSLGTPSANALANPTELESVPAVALFVERARAADSAFTVSPNDASVVAEICRRLDGIPFAIELAAARIDALTLRQLSERLDERFDILTGGGRTALLRQQTMRACIEWSYDLLSGSEKVLFRRMAIFPNGCTLAASEAVCTDERILPDKVLDLTSALLRKSLATYAREAATPRYRLLESTREYALERLAKHGERHLLSQRHAQWVAALISDSIQSGPTVMVQRSLNAVLPEVDSVRAALAWCLGEGEDLRLAAQIASEAICLWFDGGLQADGRRWIAQILPRVDESADPHMAAMLWGGLGSISHGSRVIDAAERAIGLHERAGDAEGSAFGHVLLASGLRQAGRLTRAEKAIDRALQLLRKAGLDNSWHYGNALDTKGYILLNGGRLDDARQAFEKALAHCVSVGDEHGAARTQGNLAELELALGHPEVALQLVRESTVTFQRLGAETRKATAMINAAAYLLELGRIDEAEASARDGLAVPQAMQTPQLVATAIQHLALVAAERCAYERAARLLGYVDAWCIREGYERDRGDQLGRDRLWKSVSDHLDRGVFARCIAAGASLSEAEAAALAVAELASPPPYSP